MHAIGAIVSPARSPHLSLPTDANTANSANNNSEHWTALISTVKVGGLSGEDKSLLIFVMLRLNGVQLFS